MHIQNQNRMLIFQKLKNFMQYEFKLLNKLKKNVDTCYSHSRKKIATHVKFETKKSANILENLRPLQEMAG
jgi:hypothetical protein